MFDAYSHTDDVLVIHTAAWWRPAIRCDTTKIDELHHATDALCSHLSSPLTTTNHKYN